MIDTQPEEWRKKWPELIPGTRFCEPAELKGAYVFLASEASSYMTGEFPRASASISQGGVNRLAGANMVIDGGYTLP